MIKFTEREKEILRKEFEEEISAQSEYVKEGFNELIDDNSDLSVIAGLSTAHFLLANIDNLEQEYYFKILYFYFVYLNIWSVCDDDLQIKVYSEEENELYKRIINYKW